MIQAKCITFGVPSREVDRGWPTQQYTSQELYILKCLAIDSIDGACEARPCKLSRTMRRPPWRVVASVLSSYGLIFKN